MAQVNDQIDRASSQSWSPPVQPAKQRQPVLAETERDLQKIASGQRLVQKPAISGGSSTATPSRPRKMSSAAVKATTADMRHHRLEEDRDGNDGNGGTTPDIIHAYERLAQEYRSKYPAYAALETWIDRRLAIFNQLSKDLSLAAEGGKVPTRERISHRIRQEYEGLKRDLEYRCKVAESEEMRAHLCRITEQIEHLLMDQQPRQE